MGEPKKGKKSRVVKIETEESWNFFTNQGCSVVVHFTAPWCIPSVAMNPVFEEVAMTYQDLLFLVMDVDELKEVATKMGVKAMPTFVMMRKGSEVDKVVGANPSEIKKRINAFVLSIRT